MQFKRLKCKTLNDSKGFFMMTHTLNQKADIDWTYYAYTGLPVHVFHNLKALTNVQ